jgi:hypothetical protein
MLHATRTWFGLFCGFAFAAFAQAGEYDYTSFQKIIQCKAPNGLFTPNSTDDVMSIVKQAAAANQSVRVITPNRWSITDVLCELSLPSSYLCLISYLQYLPGSDSTNGLVLSLQNFKDLTYNQTANTVTVGSGWQVQKLSEAIGQMFNVSFIHLRE